MQGGLARWQSVELADGRIYSGHQAKALGLVDQLGDSVDATKLAAEKGGIKDEKPRVRRDTEKLNDIFELLETRALIELMRHREGHPYLLWLRQLARQLQLHIDAATT